MTRVLHHPHLTPLFIAATCCGGNLAAAALTDSPPFAFAALGLVWAGLGAVTAVSIRRRRANSDWWRSAGKSGLPATVARALAIANGGFHWSVPARLALVDLARYGAFMQTSRQPVVVADRRFTDEISEKALAFVIAHELAHREHRDWLRRPMINLFSGLLIAIALAAAAPYAGIPVAVAVYLAGLLGHRSLENLADARAQCVVPDSEAIAEALSVAHHSTTNLDGNEFTLRLAAPPWLSSHPRANARIRRAKQRP